MRILVSFSKMYVWDNQCPFSSVVERLSCKQKVCGSIPQKGNPVKSITFETLFEVQNFKQISPSSPIYASHIATGAKQIPPPFFAITSRTKSQ